MQKEINPDGKQIAALAHNQHFIKTTKSHAQRLLINHFKDK